MSDTEGDPRPPVADRCAACEGTGIGLKPGPYRCRRCGGSGLKADTADGVEWGCVAVKNR